MKNYKYPLVTGGILFLVVLLSGFCNYGYAINDIDYRITSKSDDNLDKTFNPLDEFTEDDAGSGGDASDSLPFATNIIPGSYNGTLTADDIDCYTFYVEIGVIINFTMIPLNFTVDFNLQLYDPGQSLILREDPNGAGVRESIIWSTAYAGNYFAKISPATVSDIANYTFSISTQEQNDFNSGTDAGNFFATSLNISAGNSSGTMVVDSDVYDFYEISLTKGDVIDIFLKPLNTTNIDLFLFDSSVVELASSTKFTGINESIYYAISINGSYVIGVQLIEATGVEEILPYNISIIIDRQDDADSGTDAGDIPEDAYLITPLRGSEFEGRLIWNGDQRDFYRFVISQQSQIFVHLEVPENVNFDLAIYDHEGAILYSSEKEWGNEYISEILQNGTYYISIEFMTGGTAIEGQYTLEFSIIPLALNTTTGLNPGEWIPIVISAVLVPISLLIIIILVLYMFTEVRIPWVSKKLDQYFSKEGQEDSVKSLRYALRVRDDQIGTLREEMIDKDSKRAKDLESLHRLEEDQKSKEKVLTKLREESTGLKTQLDNLQAVNDDLANIIDSTIRRQLSKSSKPSQKANVSSITSLLWLSEERLVNYIQSIPLLNERYILDRSKSVILTREYAREIVRQAYWKRVGAMHLKKIKQVKIANLADDTKIEINTLKEILRELVERKEIPAPIHMDRISLLLSISEELIAELADIAQSMPIISLKEISKSYDTTPDSAKVIFERIAEEGYANGEFINDDTFVVFDLFAEMIINEGSIKISKLIEENKLQGQKEEIKIVVEKLLQSNEIEGEFLTDDMFLCFNNLTDQLKTLIKSSIENIAKGDTRRVVFDMGSVVESITKERLIIDIHETEDISKLPRYQDIIESRELGRILRAAEDNKISLPSFIELKSLNRFWAQKIKHTKPGELPYIPTLGESRDFLFEANKALNKLLSQKIPTKWKKKIAEKLLKDNK
ncbi:MAG: hypothetical protein HZR80_07250 [Candidatus Heimdallarchaeota archaeon]